MRAPTLREMDISLSFKMTTSGSCSLPMEFSASKAMPPASDASPMRATTFSSVPFNCRAFARPVAMESESDA